MRRFLGLLIFVLGLGGVAAAQSCTGLCLQQTTCTAGATTSISGVVYAPNGTDPLPNVTVYIPNAPVDAFTPGVSCPVAGSAPSGSPLVGTITAVDGSFTLSNVPVGTNIPLVIVSGRWRRHLVISSTTACVNTALPASLAVMPQNQSQGDIPLIAIATGSADPVECVLRKMGISDSEFTNPGGGGRINLFGGGGAAGSGVIVDANTPTQASLMGTYSTLQNYDALMLPCEGGNYLKPAQELANLIDFANAGGRVYSSHYSYSWMYQNPPFNGVASWIGSSSSPTPDPGVATVNTSFTAGQTLATWLQDVGATTTPGQMSISTLRKDTNGVIAPTQSWLTLNNSAFGNPVMQFVFDTPIAATNQCGRVLYNEYHVEGGSSTGTEKFPTECSSGAMTAQEKLLEYMLFELTDDGGQPSISPATYDFGSEAVGYPAATQTFTWTNNSSFPMTVSSTYVTGGDFNLATDSCTNVTVAGGQSCTVTVGFTPTALGVRTGTLTVVSAAFSQTAALTGTGVPSFSLSPNALNFGNVAIGDFATLSLTLTSNASGPQAVPSSFTTANYSESTAGCANPVPAMGTCVAKVTFSPTALGVLPGTLTVNTLPNAQTATLTGNGILGFSLSASALSFSNVVVGDSATQSLLLTSTSKQPQALPASFTTGNFSVNTAGCANPVPGLGTCVVAVTFSPTALGVQTGTLTVNTQPSALTATLTGTGIPGFTLSPTTLSFGNQDVGFPASQTLTLTSVAQRALAVPVFAMTGDYSVSTAACGKVVGAQASCLVTVTFIPQTTGPRSGTLADNSSDLVYSGLSASFSGNGVDFTITLNPTSGTVYAGDGTSTTATLTPLAGFASQLTLSCAMATGASASTCTLAPGTVIPTVAVTAVASIGTTSQYTVIGYGGYGGGGYLWLVGVGSGWLLWSKRRNGRALLRGGLLAILLAVMGLSLTGCTGKLPDQNPAWTAAGNYNVTVTATDGFLVHSATYSLTVNAK
ncbi:MAG: choice-of-anchor D domain-containing protein [Acidobacteriaceae bacterium]|nr:choice-of-anchor D domain-containing protein [Acidobacteriaceae bacterium]